MSRFLKRFVVSARRASPLCNISSRKLTDRSFRLANLLDVRAGQAYKEQVSMQNYHPFMHTAAPEKKLDMSKQILLDVRDDPSEYEKGHIKDAIYLPRDRFDFYDYLDTQGGITFDKVYNKLREIGVGSDYSDIVLYDNAGENVCRLWYVLRYFGFSHVRILNGGYQHWLKAGLPEDTTVVAPTPSKELPLKPTRTILTRPTQMLENVQHRRSKIIDTRSPSEYKASRIPGAVNVHAAQFMKDGYFKPVHDIREIMRAQGFDPENNSMGHIILYGDKNRGSSVAFYALSMAGFDRLSLYDQGISNWQLNQEQKLTIDQESQFQK
mmetsp:Transcript_16893/g.26237  ORF Transcript_16893/g.26237 Transcript_16893/m.26237 type:complete len:324 (+) Transcript_16893:58-1029(+)